jgi:hypothetical protein
MTLTNEIPEIEIPLVWNPVRLAGGIRFDWHMKPARYHRDREQLTGPKIYRWVLRNAEGAVESCYVGESAAFEKRLAAYRNDRLGRASTERLVKDEIRNCEGRGGSVEL